TPLPLTELRAVAQEGLDRVVAIRGASELETALVDADELAAAQIARGLREMGVTSKVSFDSTTLRVGTAMQPAFARLTFGLVRRKLLKKTSAGWRTTKAFDRAADSAEKILRAFLEKHPGHFSEALLCAGNGAELGSILRGEKEAVQVLFSGNGAELLDHFYGDGLFTSHWLAGIAAVISTAARSLPEGRGLRILEIGAGTRGLASP